MKSFIAKRLNSILVNLRYLRFKLLKYKENNKKIGNTFDHNFKNIPLYIMRKVSLERYYFVLHDCAHSGSKISKMALKSFCDKTLHIILPPTVSWKTSKTWWSLLSSGIRNWKLKSQEIFCLLEHIKFTRSSVTWCVITLLPLPLPELLMHYCSNLMIIAW